MNFDGIISRIAKEWSISKKRGVEQHAAGDR